MDKCSDCMPKGTYTPVLSNESSNNNLLLLIPSWLTQYGLFSDKEGRDCLRGDRKKRKRQQLNSSTTAESKKNIHQLISNEIRQCDVCGRSIVWTQTLQKQFFPHSVTSSNDDIFQQSVAESLPHFIERYITTKSSSPLPCSFCTASTASSDVDWCGSLYCSKDCQIQGEEKCTLYHPKLFFCQNRFGSGCIGSSNTNEHDELIIKEIRESIAAIEKKFKDICGYDAISIGIEECALLLMTIISCTYISSCDYNWMNDFLEEGKNMGKNRPNEESLIAELWAMSKSHHSNFLLLQNSNTEHENTTTSNSTFLPYQEFLQGYLFIKRHCILRVSSATHPLVFYAKAIVSNALSEEEMDLALDVLNSSCSSQQPHTLKNESNRDDIQSTILRWRNATHFAHWISAPSPSESDESKQISAQLRKSYFVFSPFGMFRHQKHSCAPTLALTINDTNQQSPLDTLAWLALHDIISGDMSVSKIDSLDDNVKARSIQLKELMGQDYVCACIRCRYETASSDNVVCLREGGEEKSSDLLYLRRDQLKHLADLAMQQSRFDDASKLYDCILQTYPHDGDVLHAKAASSLGKASSVDFTRQGHCNGYFLEAQRLWKKAGRDCTTHPDISIQMTKQQVYKTLIFDEEEGGSETGSTLSFTSYLGGKCFLTTEQIISTNECQHVISLAEQYATRNVSGWTTSRHHVVPTTDLPLHVLVDLHSWFYQRWKYTIRPLLRVQFQLKSEKLNRDIFLHDVFVVRYSTDQQRYLPPHYDESTHSFIISLNNDFKGGGTYIHRLGKTLSSSAGGMLSFRGGEILHSGDPTVCGVRYILAAFCYVDVIEETDNTLKEEKEPKLQDVFGSKSSEITSQEKQKQSFSFGFRV